MAAERAILAGGCFWGMEELIRKQYGVIDTTVGYTGGHTPNPTYEKLKSSVTGHAEAIDITFDNSKVAYRALLEFFFQIHDPTTLNRQGNDIGPSYRSAIFYLSDAQKQTAEELIAALTKAGIWSSTIKTQVMRAGIFYPAEAYHQDYLKRYPDGYTCHFIRSHWKLDLRQKAAARV